VGCREGTSGGRDQPVANSVPDTAAVGIRHRAIATGLTSSRFDQLSVLEISAVKNRQVGVGDPNFRELEPDRALAAPARQPTLGCVRVQCHCGQPAPQPGAGERKIDQAVLVLADFEAHAGTRGLMKEVSRHDATLLRTSRGTEARCTMKETTPPVGRRPRCRRRDGLCGR
jgi:hypothetical protein